MQVYRYRLLFSKTKPSTDLPLRDCDLFKQALKSLPLSKASSKHKFSFGPSLPMGYLSDSEYVDVYLEKRISEKEMERTLFSALPETYVFKRAKSVPLFFPSVESCIDAVEYDVYIQSDIEVSLEKFALNKRKKDLPCDIVKKSQEVSRVNAAEFLLEADYDAGIKKVNLILAFKESKTIRPEPVVFALFEKQMSISKVVRRNFLWKDSSNSYQVI